MLSTFCTYKIKIALVVLIIVCITVTTFSQQTQVSGVLKNHSSGKTISNASVLLKNSLGRIVSFNISNEEGRYRITVPDTLQSNTCFIEINSLGYKRIRQPFTRLQNVYDFLMEEDFVQLKEIEVKTALPIKKKGDTLSYDVNSFSRKEDRSIGDVIGHMPGMTVSEDGQIAYNGKNIANLYIHGDDLMDGRYGLATKSIAKEMIKSVDVMQNFQPKKVLKDKVLTQDVVVNLVLKDENSIRLAGQAMLGAGLPEQYDAAINAMLFNKKLKMLNSIKTNNSGIDYKNDFNQYGAENFLNSIDNSRPGPLLSAITAENPNLPLQNYYFNRSGALNANNLYNTKDSLQLRSNIQLYTDRNTFDYTSKQDNYLPGYTIRYNQLQHALRKPFAVNTSFAGLANRSHYYLVDKFSFSLMGENTYGYLDFNGAAFNQQLTGRTYNFSNDFNWIPLLKGKDLLSLQWGINFNKGSQNLYADTGLNNRVLNNGKDYSATGQYAAIPVFFSNASLEYIIGGKHLIRAVYGAGIVNEWQQLNSVLSLTQKDGSLQLYQGDPGNRLHWQRNKAYLNATWVVKKKDWEASVSVPVYWQSIHYYQDAYSLDQSNQRTFVNPQLSIKRYVNSEDYFSASYTYNNRFGNISGVYRGSILTNYQTLTANDAALQERVSSSAGIQYNFQRSIILLFMNAGIQYNKVTASSILSSVITNTGLRTVLLPVENDQSSVNAHAGISKYFFSLKTKLTINTSWKRNYYQQFINTQRLPFTNDAFNLGIGIDGKLVKDVVFSYSGSGSWNKSFSASNGIENKIQIFDQNMGFGYTPTEGFFLNLKARELYSKQSNLSNIDYWFVDANVRYKLKKLRTDLELGLTNLLDVKEYRMLSLSSNQFTASNYEIRGRMLIVRATFNL